MGASRSPGVQIGSTVYDYQTNGSIGRAIVYKDGSDYSGIHVDWMCLPCDESEARHIKYNASSDGGVNWAWETGTDGGKKISDDNGGYCTIDVTYTGAAVAAWHHGTISSNYAIRADDDSWPPFGYFDEVDGAPSPPNCEGWETGGNEMGGTYIWPRVEYDLCDADTVYHVIGTESNTIGDPPVSVTPKTMVYYRRLNHEWPTCATAIDSEYCISGIVRQDPASNEIAIVWLHPLVYEDDPNDPCPGWYHFQNDVYVLKSSDCGVTWDRESVTNVTDYTVGGTVSITMAPYMAYLEVSALYDQSGVLHVIWGTPMRDHTNGPTCQPLYASRMWHWDDGPTGCISLLYDASRPLFFCPTGAWANSACKINISECDGKLYTSFTRFGAHTSADGDTNADCSAANFANADVLLTATTDGGKTWGEAVNLTNTNSDGCEAGDCESEHWPSMAKYSTGVVHIRYIEDKDAGGYPMTEGDTTCNPVRYLSHECFTPETFCQVAYSPSEIGYPLFISPQGQSDCTGEETTSFTLTLTNVGSQTTDYSISSTQSWLTPASAVGNLPAGCGNIQDIEVQIGPIADEGIYDAELHITTCSARKIDTVSVQIHVFCEFYIPEHEILSTACWSVGVWNTARAGTAQWNDPEGNMYWFLDEISLMYDESVVITYAEDTCQTWFSLFDGSEDEVSLVALGPLTTASFGTYEYAHALWANGDTTIVGEIEYYLPVHPDTCVLIERIKVCNNTDAEITIHIGEAIDWDIPDGTDGSENQCGVDETRQMLYQYGPAGGPEENYYGGASFCHDIPGAIVLTNLDWIYNNSGYVPCEIGGLLARHTGFEADTPDSMQDLNSVYVIGQNVVIEPDSCVVYCKVKTSSLIGLTDLQLLIDKGKAWIQDHELDCPGCIGGPCDTDIGNADGSTEQPTIDIDDVVYLIAYIFSGGPEPVPYKEASGDANCSCPPTSVDIDDVVYLIAYIFSGGPQPCSCEEWVAACGPLQ